ncbi:MAG: archaellin/type IV pilin N-terminal domain-containing protein [Nanoarchaeota archaeon]
MERRGVSDLVSIIILILIIILLAGFVFVVFDVEKYLFTIEDDLCKDVEIVVLDACYNDEFIIIEIENKGVEINNGFLFKLFGNEVYEVPSPPLTNLKGFGIEGIVLPYEDFVGEINKVLVFPKIKTSDGVIVCENKEEYNVVRC